MSVNQISEQLIECHHRAKNVVSECSDSVLEAFNALKDYEYSKDTVYSAVLFGGAAMLLGGGFPAGAAVALTAAVAVNVLQEETVEAVKEGVKWSFIGGVICSGGNPFIGLVSAVASTASTLFSQFVGPLISSEEGSMPQYERLGRRFISMIVGNGVAISLAGFNPSLIAASAANFIYDSLFGEGEQCGKATPIFNM